MSGIGDLVFHEQWQDPHHGKSAAEESHLSRAGPCLLLPIQSHYGTRSPTVCANPRWTCLDLQRGFPSMEPSHLARLYTRWIDYPGYPLEPDFPRDEYDLRLSRARAEMAALDLDALVITSHAVGSWFTSQREPHEWHDQCQARSTWFILTHDGDYLYMPPTACGEHFNTTRRSTWVTHIRAIAERATPPRAEIWGIEQMVDVFPQVGLTRGRLGFELGDCMSLGIGVNEYMRLVDMLPDAQFVDGSPAIRRLMSIHTPLEIERVRKACRAGVWIHDRVPEVLRPGMTEWEFVGRLGDVFGDHFSLQDPSYAYRGEGAWDVRNPETGDSNFFHAVLTDRVFKAGDLICRGTSGASFRGYGGDVDRVWYIGAPPEIVRYWYATTWECNQAMAAAIQPGKRCSDVYAACARVEAERGFPERLVGRAGHGLRNTGGLSVHPDCHTVLEPGMILSVEAMFGHEYGFYDLEDQYLVTEAGHELLNPRAPEEMPTIAT